jgi:death-on-curing protein
MAGLTIAALPGRLFFRLQSGYYEDILAEAAALWESLPQNHPSVDGNKRTAFAATNTFLAINGVEITASADEIWTYLNTSYGEGAVNFANLEIWLRSNRKAG